MVEQNEVITGIFLSEIKNRFLCSVLVNGEETVCYIPSSCRLSNFIKLQGKLVLLKPIQGKNARTKYAVYAVKIGRGFILLNMSESNRVVEQQLYRKYFSFLGKRKQISHELKIGDYKADLFIHDTKTIIEIKSILTVEKHGYFPTVHSERAIEQLKKMKQFLNDGYNVCYMLVSLNPYIEKITISESDNEYKELFKTCVEKGMSCFGVTIKLDEYEPYIYKTVEVEV